jgi:hypothetical protein
MKSLVFLIALLLVPVKVAPLPNVVFLMPDYNTLWLELSPGVKHFECEAWPIEPFRPQSFYMRGQLADASGNVIGRYFARGAINNLDGSHVAEYALTFIGIGTVVYSVDSSPDVFPYVYDTHVAFGIERGQPVHLELTPSLRPGCVWGHEWQARITIGAPQ